MDWRSLRETSAAQGLAHCNQCGKCCENSGCTLAAGDAERIAKHLGITLREFYRRHTAFADDAVVMLTPCNFYVNKLCSIQPVKPTGGREFECWDLKPVPTWRVDDLRRAARKAGLRVLAS